MATSSYLFLDACFLPYLSLKESVVNLVAELRYTFYVHGRRIFFWVRDSALTDVVLHSRFGSKLAEMFADQVFFAPQSYPAKIEKKLPGICVDARNATASFIVACGMCTVFGGWFSCSMVGAIAAVALFIASAWLWEQSKEKERLIELEQAMPAVFRTLASALGSGQTLPQAIEYVGIHEKGRMGAAFRRSSLMLFCGESIASALESLAGEVQISGVDLLVSALLISQRTGSPLRNLFFKSAELLEKQHEVRRMVTVKTAQVGLSVRIVCGLPIVMIALLALISPDFQRGLLSPQGLLSCLIAAMLDGIALLVIKRLMKGVGGFS